VGCPDARPPAYEAVAGLAEAGRLDQFVTSFFDTDNAILNRLRGLLPRRWQGRVERQLGRRRHSGIPSDRVISVASVDAWHAAERRFTRPATAARRALVRARTAHFDRILAQQIARRRPGAVLLFSDVGSTHAGATCRRLGIPVILSMVHGDVREELQVLKAERERSPEVFDLYLGDGRLDLDELAWLHARRLRDLQWADRILVPSEHIAGELERHGTPRERIEVVPYAADLERFRPTPGRRHTESCTFLFAGGISQRKGIKYLLQAWQLVRRPGWRLQLLGAPPERLGSLATWLEGVELLGRVPHAEVPGRMAEADVFVFPSLFEGSAVVTYEALACGLPSILTTEAGGVARDGIDGLIVPAADPAALARAMITLGENPSLRERMSRSARNRAEAFGWARYRAALLDAIDVVTRS
jgi:hypothetical protein